MKDENMPLINIEFCLTGDKMDFDLITNKLKIYPTRTRMKKDWPQASINNGFACDSWEYSTTQVISRSVNNSFKKILNFLRGKEDLINELCKEYNFSTSFSVVVHMKAMSGPEFTLNREVISFLASIGSEIGFDIYTY